MKNSDPSVKIMFTIKGLVGVYFLVTGTWNLATLPFTWAFPAMILLGLVFTYLMWIDPLRNEMLLGKKPQDTASSEAPEGSAVTETAEVEDCPDGAETDSGDAPRGGSAQ